MKIAMPKDDPMAIDGTITKWYKAEGEAIAKDEPMADYEINKKTITVNAPVSGTFHIIVEEGETADCGEEIAEIAE